MHSQTFYIQTETSAGMRFEAYLNPILGFDKEYKGAGFAYRFASYKKDYLEITAGNYYEQFGKWACFFVPMKKETLD